MGKSVSKIARRRLRKRPSLFLARPRELRGRMFNGIVLIQSPHLTQREADGGYAPVFGEVFSRWALTPTAANAPR